MKSVKCNFCINEATNQEEDSFYYYELCNDCQKNDRVKDLIKKAIQHEENCDKQENNELIEMRGF